MAYPSLGVTWPPPEWQLDPMAVEAANAELLAQQPAPMDYSGLTPAAPPPLPQMPPPVDPAMAGAPGGEPWPPPEWQAQPVEPPPVPAPPPVRPPMPSRPPMGPSADDGIDNFEADMVPAGEPGYQPQTAAAKQAGRVSSIEADAADVAAAGRAREAEIGRARVQDMELQRLQRTKHLADAEQQLERERQEIKNTKIDENQWWDGQSTGKKLMFIGGGILSGMLDVSLGRGPGSGVVDMMQHLVQRNLDTQKANLTNKREALSEGRGLYAQLAARYQDEAVADNMFMALALDQEKRNVAAQLAQYESPLAKERGIGAMMELDRAQKAAEQAAAQAMADQRYKRGMERAELGVKQYSAQTGRMDVEEKARAREEAARVAGVKTQKELTTDQRERGVFFSSKPGEILGTVPTKEEGVKARGVIGDYERAKSKLDTYNTLREKYHRSGFLEPTEQGELEQARRDLQLLYKSEAFAHLGVLTGKDLSVLDAVIAAPDGYTTVRDADGAMANLGRSMDKDIDQRLGGLGYAGPKVSELYATSRKKNDDDIPSETAPGMPKMDPAEAAKNKRERADKGSAELDSNAPRPEWEIVGTNNGLSETAGGLMVPANDPPVKQTNRYTPDGKLRGVVYTLKSGKTIYEEAQ